MTHGTYVDSAERARLGLHEHGSVVPQEVLDAALAGERHRDEPEPMEGAAEGRDEAAPVRKRKKARGARGPVT